MKYDVSDPRHHYSKLRDMLTGVADHAREGVGKVSDPTAQARFEATTEVREGLVRAYDHAEAKSEPAWR